MLRTGLIALALAALAAPALAGPGHGHHREHLNRVAEELGLDDTQREQFATIMREQHQQVREMRRSMRDQGIKRDSEEARAHREAMHAQVRERLGTVLTAEQLERFDALRHERMQRKLERRERHREHDSDTL